MSTVRDVLVGGAGSAAAVTFAQWAAELAARGPDTVDGLVATAAAGLGAALGAWYAATSLVLLAARIAAWRSRGSTAAALVRTASRWGAPLLRGTAAAAVGAGLVLGVPPAFASVQDSPATAESIEGVPLDLRPGFGLATNDEPRAKPPSPAHPEPAIAPTAPPAPAAPSTAQPVAHRTPAEHVRHSHVVEPGDSLWSITAASLGAGATDAQIAAEWPRWYRTNRSVIGADPDLIHPGQVLLAPEPKDVP